MDKMNFTVDGEKAVCEILQHMQAASAAIARLNAVENKTCFDFHSEGASLNHCIRWGTQAADDIHTALGQS